MVDTAKTARQTRIADDRRLEGLQSRLKTETTSHGTRKIAAIAS
jgi:hypothetical protein